MSIVSVGKMWSRDGGSTTSDGRKITQTIREGWQVVTSADATLAEVTFAAGLPQINQPYSGTNWIFCTSSTPTRVGPIYWTVDVEYKGDIGPGGQADTPVNMPPDIEYSDSETEEPVDQDDYGYPITNVNGEPVNGVTDSIADLVLSVTRNYISFSPYLTRLYRRSVNSDYFADWPPGTAKLRRFRAKYVVSPTLGYWQVSAEVHFREPANVIAARSWWKRYRNEGLYVRSGTIVTFTGGGADTQAKGYPVIDDAGKITAISLTDAGSGYTSAPTVAITGGAGSGATATASLLSGFDFVETVTITNGGSNYKAGNNLIRAVDGRKEAMTTPVLLKADGTFEPNADNATWITRPVGVRPLPYNALGLI